MSAPSYQWVTRPRVRPDQYQDWQEQLKIGQCGDDGSVSGARRALRIGDPPSERWASVSFAIKPNPDDATAIERKLANVNRLVEDTRNPSDGAAAMPRMAMTAPQIGRLQDAIQLVKPGSDKPVVLSAYLVVGDIYDPQTGGFRDYPDLFEIRYADPPVPGLDLSRIFDAGVRSTIQKGIDPPPAVIAIIDDGVAFANERFRSFLKADNKWATHFAYVWLQDIERTPDNPDEGLIEFGQELSADQINKLLNEATDEPTGTVSEAAIYRKTGAQLNDDRPITLARAATHGAHVLDIATGGQPDIPIYAVQLPTDITEDTSGRLLSYYAREGLQRIFEVVDQEWGALNVPLIINFSYGFQAGPKDGSTFFVQELDRLVNERRRLGQVVELILPAGNAFEADTHAKVTLDPSSQSDTPTEQVLTWQIQPDDRTENFIEVHIERNGAPIGTDDFALSLKHPFFGTSGSARLVSNELVTLEKDGLPIAGLYWEPADGHFGSRLLLAINRTNARDGNQICPARAGAWTITLKNTSEDKTVTAHLTVQRDDTLSGFRPGGRQSYLEHPNSFTKSMKTGNYTALDLNGPVTGRGTLSALAGSEVARIIGAATVDVSLPTGDHVPANAVCDVGVQPSRYTASGATANRSGPDASAVVDQGDWPNGTYATGTFSGSSFALNGTSVAAPQIARVLVEKQGDWSALESQAPSIDSSKRHQLGQFFVDRRLEPPNTQRETEE